VLRPGDPARSRLTNHSFHADHMVVSRVKEITGSGDGTGLLGHLGGEAVQTFVNVVHEVCSSIHSLPRPGLIIAFTASNRLGFRFPKPSATAPEEVLERFVPNLRSSGCNSQFVTNPSSLQPVEHPTVQRWTRGRMERRIPRPPSRSQGYESVLDQ
jgi:hypothetical protein